MGSLASSHKRKPPRNALPLSPARHFGGTSFSSFTLPAPSTTSSGSRAAISRATTSATWRRRLLLPCFTNAWPSGSSALHNLPGRGGSRLPSGTYGRYCQHCVLSTYAEDASFCGLPGSRGGSHRLHAEYIFCYSA